MKIMIYIGIGIVLLIVIVAIGNFYLNGLRGMGNPTGGNTSPDYPYFITNEPTEV